MKFFSRKLWSLLFGFFAVWLVIVIIGQNYALKYSSTINNLLDINPYVVKGEVSERLYNSDFLNEDGTFDDEAMRAESMEAAKTGAAEGAVLLWNNEVNGQAALPLEKGARVNLFGIGSVSYKLSGGGSGEVKASPEENFKGELEKSGFAVNTSLFTAYSALRSDYGSRNKQGVDTKNNAYNGKNGYTDIRYREFYVNEPTWDTVNGKMTKGIEGSIVGSKNAQGYPDAAIMVITRDGCEDGDTWFPSDECYDGNYLDLSYNEAEILENLVRLKNEGKVNRVVVLLNTTTTICMKHLVQYDIDACLYVGCGGVTSFKAIASLLSGETNPSGRLADTLPYDVDSAPAVENFGDFKWTQSTGLETYDTQGGTYNNSYVVYQEGIYVGYRYYETRYEDVVMQKGNASSAKGVKNGSGNWNYAQEVAYPFGYGISYTDFEMNGYAVEEKSGDYNGTFEVSFNVKNVGAIAGKTPVGVYLQKPYTSYDKEHGVEKAAVELVGFVKTDLLQPGEEKKYTVTVKGSEFKSYDTYGAGTYILEKGDYYLAAGFDAHEALNNILAAKGYARSDGMVDSLGKPADGNAAFAYKKEIKADDFGIFSTSEWSGYPIENQLSDADTNLYAGTADQKVTYLSRQDWEGTYPSPIAMKCVNDIMVADMKYSHDVDWGTAEMPTMDSVTVPENWFEENKIELDENQEKKLTLTMMNGLDYDDEAWDHLLNQMNWTEMQKMLCGGYLTLQGAVSVGAPGGNADDGSSGAPRNAEALGRKLACGAIMSFPIETLQAQTWDKALVERMGVAFGHECLHNEIAELYAPVANMHRSAYGGRNWETYSEDPVLSGEMLTAECAGIQSKGIIVNAKHFAINDQEINRCGVATWFNEQTAREIYLRTFEIGINGANIKSLMASFPRFGCRWCGHYSGLMTEILRKEWNFKGFVETDSAFNQQYMTYNQNGGTARAEGVVAGVDFWMDGSPSEQFSAFGDNAVVVNAVREACHRMLYVQCNSIIINGMSTKSIVEYETPYWEAMIQNAKIAVAVIAGVCLVLAVSSFVVYGVCAGKKKAN